MELGTDVTVRSYRGGRKAKGFLSYVNGGGGLTAVVTPRSDPINMRY